MKSVIVAFAGAIAVLGVGTLAQAQEPRGQRPAAQPQRAAPQPGAAAPRAERPRPQMQRPAARAPSRPMAAERSRPQRPAAAQRATERRAAERSAVRERRAERERSQQRQRAEQGRARQEHVARDRAERSKQAQERREQLKTRHGQTQAPAPGIVPKQAEKAQRRPEVADKDAQRGPQPVARIQATDEQRREVRQRLFQQRNVRRIDRRRLGAPITVGSHVPRRHRLHRFTPALIAFAPFYASYSYLVVDDTICVVDPETYVIVDVLPASIEQAEAGPGSRPALTLTPEERSFILANVPKDRARTDVRIRLALGAEIPRSVELLTFPEKILERVPKVGRFRYVVVEDDVVIVDPRDYEIALVISG